MQGKSVHLILQKRNSKKECNSLFVLCYSYSVIIITIMPNEKYKVSNLLYVSNFFFFFFIAVNWACWWTASRDKTVSPLFLVQPCWTKKKKQKANERKERNGLANQVKGSGEFRGQLISNLTLCFISIKKTQTKTKTLQCHNANVHVAKPSWFYIVFGKQV